MTKQEKGGSLFGSAQSLIITLDVNVALRFRWVIEIIQITDQMQTYQLRSLVCNGNCTKRYNYDDINIYIYIIIKLLILLNNIYQLLQIKISGILYLKAITVTFFVTQN